MPATTTALLCPDILDRRSPEGLRVTRLTPNEAFSELVYLDKHWQLANGDPLVHTHAGLQICRLQDGGTLEPLPGEIDPSARVELAPDGRHLIYGQMSPGDTRFELYRYDLQERHGTCVFSAGPTVDGTRCPWTQTHLTPNWDASRIAGLVYLDYDRQEDGRVGIIVIDTATSRAEIVCRQPLPHSHLRYYPGPELPHRHDLMVQHHHGGWLTKDGRLGSPPVPPADRGGVDLHILRDDGSHWRDLPFGRDGASSCIGHQVWRYPSQEVASIMLQADDNSFGWADGTRQHLVTGRAVPSDRDAPHVGGTGREAHRTLLSENLPDARLCHLAVDRSGLRFALDTFPVFDGERAGMQLYLGQSRSLHEPLEFAYLLNTGVVFHGSKKRHQVHAHPVLSRDGQRLFFNSDWLGSCQAFMLEGLPWPIS